MNRGDEYSRLTLVLFGTNVLRMAAKTPQERVSKYDAKRKAEGYKRVAVWIPAAFEKRFRDYLEKLTKEFERTKE